MNEPLDIKPQWLNVARRMQQAAAVSNNLGVAIMTLHVIFDCDGLPVGYIEPRCVKIDPKRNADMLLKILTS
jgi:hypothetical protein